MSHIYHITSFFNRAIMNVNFVLKSRRLLLLFVFVLSTSTILFSQSKSVSLEDAVLRQWSTFAPTGISSLQWMSTAVDEMSMVEDDRLLMSINEKSNENLTNNCPFILAI